LLTAGCRNRRSVAELRAVMADLRKAAAYLLSHTEAGRARGFGKPIKTPSRT
jgi:hypothetical protein